MTNAGQNLRGGSGGIPLTLLGLALPYIPSMSRPDNCFDNAAMESFWSGLKRELVYRCKFATHAAGTHRLSTQSGQGHRPFAIRFCRAT